MQDEEPKHPPLAMGAITVPHLARLEDKKQAVLTIEGLVHAIKNAGFPLQWYEPAAAGVLFIKQIHDALIAALTPEELEQFKAEQGNLSPPASPNGKGGYMNTLRSFMGRKH